MLKISIVLIMALSLLGCAANKPAKPEVFPDLVKPKIVVDSSVLKECPPLTEPSTSEEFSIVVIENTQKYAECRLLQHNSIKVIKKLTEE
jgi:hypothetical protein